MYVSGVFRSLSHFLSLTHTNYLSLSLSLCVCVVCVCVCAHQRRAEAHSQYDVFPKCGDPRRVGAAFAARRGCTQSERRCWFQVIKSLVIIIVLVPKFFAPFFADVDFCHINFVCDSQRSEREARRT